MTPYIEENKDRFLSELKELLSIPSVSTAPEHKQDVLNCASWLQSHFESIGMENVEILPTEGHPSVYADWLHAGDDKPTVLVYGHYDVQPVDPIELWTNDPFEPTVRDGKIFARGATDDKGQVFLHVKSLETMLKSDGSLPVNVKVLIEGEEEVGSEHLVPLLERHKEKLACDTILISDTAMYSPEVPSLCIGLRGLAYMEVEVTGPNRDLHSGSFGGGIENPANVLCGIIARLKDEYGRVTVPGFYDDVEDASEREKQDIASLPFDEEKYCEANGVGASRGEFGYSVLERLWTRPTLDVNGMWSGFTGVGAKTVLPSKATAKISMRLVPNQNTHDIAKKFEDYIVSIAPKTVKVKVTDLHGGNPALTEPDSAGIQAASVAMEEAYGKRPVLTREGGSIPIVLDFQNILSAPVVLMGFGLQSENLHSPDEHFHLENFYKGIFASTRFFHQMAAQG